MTQLRTIRPIPMSYRGVSFRSTLEADWAATLDSLGIVWQYEPEGVLLPSGVGYRPDFYLPDIATWLEVKGPCGERINKVAEFAEAVFHSPDCPDPMSDDTGCCGGEYQLVVVGLAPCFGRADWRLIDSFSDGPGQLVQCRSCGAWWWLGEGTYGCRRHRRYQGGDDDLGGKTLSPVHEGGDHDLYDVRRPATGEGWTNKTLAFQQVSRPCWRRTAS